MVDLSFLLEGKYWANSTVTYTFSKTFLNANDERRVYINTNISKTIDLPTIADGNSALASAAMTAWSNVAGIIFKPSTSPASADIAILQANVIGTPTGFASVPTYTAGNIAGAAIFLQSGQPLNVYLHELGHALGLSHPGGIGSSFSDPNYNTNTTIMSSNYGGRPAITPMIYDIAAIQSIYGANTSHNSGNTTYRFPVTTLPKPSGTVVTTIRSMHHRILLMAQQEPVL